MKNIVAKIKVILDYQETNLILRIKNFFFQIMNCERNHFFNIIIDYLVKIRFISESDYNLKN